MDGLWIFNVIVVDCCLGFYFWWITSCMRWVTGCCLRLYFQWFRSSGLRLGTGLLRWVLGLLHLRHHLGLILQATIHLLWRICLLLSLIVVVLEFFVFCFNLFYITIKFEYNQTQENKPFSWNYLHMKHFTFENILQQNKWGFTTKSYPLLTTPPTTTKKSNIPQQIQLQTLSNIKNRDLPKP